MGDNRSDWTSQEIWQGFQIVDAPAKSDELAAAERAVVEAAIRWRASLRPEGIWQAEPHAMRGDALREYSLARRQLDYEVGQFLRLRAAHASQGGGG